MAKETAFSIPSSTAGSGQPNICPIEIYISGSKNENDTISRIFICFSCSAITFFGLASAAAFCPCSAAP